jgi:hypothetical protein
MFEFGHMVEAPGGDLNKFKIGFWLSGVPGRSLTLFDQPLYYRA